jgi:hypothetical protein
MGLKMCRAGDVYVPEYERREGEAGHTEPAQQDTPCCPG